MRLAGIIPALLVTALTAAGPAFAQVAFPGTSQPEVIPPLGAFVEEPSSDYFDLDRWQDEVYANPLVSGGDWQWQILPDGILYRAYLANPKESRMGTQVFSLQGDGALWDSTLGGRVGILRFGTNDSVHPQGWQFDVEGSAQVRLDPDENLNLTSVDYRVGLPLTYAYGRHGFKLGYYHLCSHLGDEFLEAHPTFQHLNFVRDAVTIGYAYYVMENLRVFGEIGYAFSNDVSQEWEFQFGFEYAPSRPTGIAGAPFVAAFGHLREELNYSGNFVFQAGWAWRGQSTHLLRTGFHYYNGLSDQYSFYRNFEQQIGGGLWYDF